jgi:hypothetical protein
MPADCSGAHAVTDARERRIPAFGKHKSCGLRAVTESHSSEFYTKTAPRLRNLPAGAPQARRRAALYDMSAFSGRATSCGIPCGTVLSLGGSALTRLNDEPGTRPIRPTMMVPVRFLPVLSSFSHPPSCIINLLLFSPDFVARRRRRAWMQGARPEGAAGVLDGTSTRPTERNAADTPESAAAAESW